MEQANGTGRATIVLTTRDRYSLIRDSIANLYENTDYPFDLVVVTGAAPGQVRRWCDDEAARRGFRHVAVDRPLTPAEARNTGIEHARGEYIAFVENDIMYRKDWLGALVACGDETGAGMVAPLTCEGRPIHTIVHHIGPEENNNETLEEAGDGHKDFHEEFYLQGNTLDEIQPHLKRRRTQSVEMHCFMVRRSLFDRIGTFDPDIVSKEYLDFSWRAREAGESIWFEPSSVVTFLIPSEDDPVQMVDLPYFLLRWSRSWQKRSHDALKAKWNLQEDGFISYRRSLADWRIVDHVTRPTLSHVPVVGKRWGFVQRAAVPVNFCLNAASNLMAWRYDRARGGKGGKRDHAA